MSVSPPGRKRQARESNPHDLAVARLSKAARQPVSNCFPSRSTPGRSRTCFKVGLQPTAGAVRSDVFREPEPAVGLEPTWSALRGRCPARRASPAFVSSPCWCQANATEVQSPGPLARAWPAEDPEPAAGLEPARAPIQEGCSTNRAALAQEGGRRESNPHNPGSQPGLAAALSSATVSP